MLGLTATIRELLNSRPFDVAVVDAQGDHVTGFDSSRPATAAITSVASSATSVSLLAANAARRRVIVHNDSTKTLRIAFGVAASATVFSVIVPSKAQYESPLNDYTGELFGIWDSANGSARVTEITT